VASGLECSSLVAMASLDREHGRGRSQERGRGRQTTYVVKKTVRDVGGAQYPMLTRTNYTEWVVLMKVMLKARCLWAVVTVGTADEEDDQSAMEDILKSVSAESVVPLGAKDSAKEAWESLETKRLGGDRVRKAKAQQLRREYEAIAFRDGEAIEDFALQLTSLVSQLAQVGVDIGEEEAVAKYLRVVPPRFAQIVLSIETLLDMSTLSIEDVTGRLKAVEDRAEAPARTTAGGQLLLTEEQWAARLRERKQGEGSSVSRSSGKGGVRGWRCGKDGGDRAADKDRCRNCGKIGHWARDCKEPRRQEREHLAQDDEEELALLMTQVCTINTEAENRGGRVELDEPRARVNLGRAEELWYLDTGASNHMTENRAAFSELDTGVIGTVKFGDNSGVDIQGRGTVVFQCKNGEHKALTCVLHPQAPEQHRPHWPARRARLSGAERRWRAPDQGQRAEAARQGRAWQELPLHLGAAHCAPGVLGGKVRRCGVALARVLRPFEL